MAGGSAGNTARLSFYQHNKQRYYKGFSLRYILNRAVLGVQVNLLAKYRWMVL